MTLCINAPKCTNTENTVDRTKERLISLVFIRLGQNGEMIEMGPSSCCLEYWAGIAKHEWYEC